MAVVRFARKFTLIKLVAMSGLGVFALAGFLSSDIMNFVNYVIAVVIAMVVTFAITFVTFKDEA